MDDEEVASSTDIESDLKSLKSLNCLEGYHHETFNSFAILYNKITKNICNTVILNTISTMKNIYMTPP